MHSYGGYHRVLIMISRVDLSLCAVVFQLKPAWLSSPEAHGRCIPLHTSHKILNVENVQPAVCAN